MLTNYYDILYNNGNSGPYIIENDEYIPVNGGIKKNIDWDAINKFDPEKNVKFKTYAVTRIRGAIFDELRALDWVPRSVRQKSKEIEKKIERLKRINDREEVQREIEILKSENDAIMKIFHSKTTEAREK